MKKDKSNKPKYVLKEDYVPKEAENQQPIKKKKIYVPKHDPHKQDINNQNSRIREDKNEERTFQKLEKRQVYRDYEPKEKNREQTTTRHYDRQEQQQSRKRFEADDDSHLKKDKRDYAKDRSTTQADHRRYQNRNKERGNPKRYDLKHKEESQIRKYEQIKQTYKIQEESQYRIQRKQIEEEKEDERKKAQVRQRQQNRKALQKKDKQKHLQSQRQKERQKEREKIEQNRQREKRQRQIQRENDRIKQKERQQRQLKQRQRQKQKKQEDQQKRKRQQINKKQTQKNINLVHDSEEEDENLDYQNIKRKEDLKIYQTKQQSKEICSKYLEDSYLVERDSHGLQQKIKKLKKLLKIQVSSAESIRIIASNRHPMILFEYFQSKQSKSAAYMCLLDFLLGVKLYKEKRDLLQDVFGRLFTKVPPKYYKMVVFGVEKAKEKNILLNKSNIFDVGQGNDVMFYYAKDKQNHINFTLFDSGLRFFEFNTIFVQSHKTSHPEEYQSFVKFQRLVFQQEKQGGQGVDLLDNEELSSDQEDRVHFQEQSLPDLRAILYSMINKNVGYLDQIIDAKQVEMREEGQSDPTSTKFLKIAEQFQDLTENRDNFINVRNEITETIMNNKENKEMFKSGIKKMIIAEKQLESKLPIVAKKRKIFDMLHKQNLLIIEGETGSGKSTQLPQMLCEYYRLFDNPYAKPVLVTQPRRLATRTLAERVAKQMGQMVGGFVDYVASAGKKANKNAKIIFQLDRLVLDQMTVDPLLTNYSCLVIDEAHERTISIDVILGLVKKLLSQRKDFKVIVTSASMDIKLFEDYFKTHTLKVSGRTFPVTITYKDYQRFKEGDKYQMVHKICKIINQQILYDSSNMKNEFKGHILCFCSSIDDINELIRIYSAKLNKYIFDVHALHGKVTPADQKKVFLDTGKHKFIFANRIAETAVTIDGVRVVIDPGQDIELVYDQKFKVSSMKLQEITQSSAKQRAGRSGRTGPGHCFRLYSEENFKKRKPNKIPEIKNSSLQTVVLRLKTLRINDVINFPYLQKPDTDGLKKSLEILSLIGAINPQTERVTKIGELLIKLPIEPFLSRSIVEAIFFQKVFRTSYQTTKHIEPKQLNEIRSRGIKETVIEILALIINFSNLFFIRKQDGEKGEAVKYNQFSDEEGDFFFLDNIYRTYKTLKTNQNTSFNKFGDKQQNYNGQLNQWMKKNYLNYRALGQINELINQIFKIIEDYSIKETQYENELDTVKFKIRSCKSFRQIILSCLITSFAANLCKFSGNQEVGYTIVSQRRPIHIYGTSNLSLLGIKSDWIICYDLYSTQQGRFYCKLAHKVEYKFMKNHIDHYIWDKFKIEEIERENPFYIPLECQLPTKYVQQIKSDNYKSDYQPVRLGFFKQLFPSISQETNKVSFYLQRSNQDNVLQTRKTENMKKKLDSYLKRIHDDHQKLYRHNYISNIFINFKKGFEIQSIQFNNIEFCIEVIVQSSNMVELIQQDCKFWGTCTVEDVRPDRKNQKTPNQAGKMTFEKQRKKVKVFIIQETNKNAFIQYLNQLVQNTTQEICFRETLIDKRRKIPQTKILMHYFAGTSQKDNLLISYYSYPPNFAQKQLQLLRSALNKRQQNNFETKLLSRNLRLTKAGNGINVLRCSYDEFQIKQEIYQLEKLQLLTFQFKFPNFIKKFREPEILQAAKTNQQWRQQIWKLLENINVNPQNIAFNVQGHYKPKRVEGEKVTALEKFFRVDMNATLTTLDNTVYHKLKKEYDGKQGIIGCEKVHIRAVYEQIIAVVNYRVFDSLRDEYMNYIEDYKEMYPLLNIEDFPINTKKEAKIMIKARSPNREDFVEPQRVISGLFSPKLIKLELSEFRFLDRTQQGNEVLYQIQEDYGYKIYFGVQRSNNSLKLFCEDSQLPEIVKRLKQEIQKFKFYSERISYRGKNLNKIKQLLEKCKKELKKSEHLQYQIIFQTRNIQVIADIATFQRVKNKILKLSEVEKGECDICADTMRNPYRFIDCSCTFCWLCITQHIRTFRNSLNEDILYCPSSECKKPINMNDVRTLLTEEQFENICDIKVKRYVQINSDKYKSCNYCENIFLQSDIQESGQAECEICGKSQCLKCKQSHPHYTCEERKNTIQKMVRCGVKQCSQCKVGIQKEKGCNHVECRNCGTHLCWKCLKKFKTSKQCYDHLAKQCGGIFDNPH